MAHRDMADQAAGGGYHHVGAQGEALGLLVVAPSIVAAIDGHTADTVEIVAEAFHRLVYLLGEFAGRTHNDAVDGIVGIEPVVDEAEDGEKIGGGLAGACLGYAYHVAPVEYLGDTCLLDRSAGLKTHVIERIEYVVIQV